ncbi:unnamed protein product [Ectocarpus sp. 13 AM-2016]
MLDGGNVAMFLLDVILLNVTEIELAVRSKKQENAITGALKEKVWYCCWSLHIMQVGHSSGQYWRLKEMPCLPILTLTSKVMRGTLVRVDPGETPPLHRRSVPKCSCTKSFLRRFRR